jgi:hypothetical protein
VEIDLRDERYSPNSAAAEYISGVDGPWLAIDHASAGHHPDDSTHDFGHRPRVARKVGGAEGASRFSCGERGERRTKNTRSYDQEALLLASRTRSDERFPLWVRGRLTR